MTSTQVTRKEDSLDVAKAAGKCETSFDKNMTVGEVRSHLENVTLLMSGGWGHQRIEEERRRQEQERLRSQVQFDTYAAAGGLATADVPKGEGVAERQKRERSEDDDEDVERRDEDKRFRGE